MTTIVTANLTLNPCHPNDSADFIALERDPEVMRFLNGGHAINIDHSEPDANFLMPRGTEPYVWTARRTIDDAFVGWFCLWQENESLAELGYRLRRNQWGQGFASEGSSALCRHGFQTCGYDRIFASTMTVNHASRRVLEKIGMHYVRQIHVDWPVAFPGTEHGEVIYEILRSGWAA
jgi:RimJ/RimL family protein N-acetyltransferase